MPAPQGNKYALGNKGGRPPRVKASDLPDFGRELVRWAEQKFDELMSAKTKEEKTPFFIKTFCREHKISEDTLSAYRKANKEFSASYKEARHIIAEALMIGALKGWWHPTAFIFIAKNETEMKDSNNLDILSGGEKINLQIIDFKRSLK